MKTLLLFVLLVGLVGCTDKAIETVKKSAFNDQQTVAQHLAESAGINGTIEWEGFRPAGNPLQSRVVNARVKVNNRSASVQWLVNTETDFVQMHAIEIDNEPKTLFSGLLALSSLATSPLEEKKHAEFECYIKAESGECTVQRIAGSGAFKYTDKDGNVVFTNMNRWGKSNVIERRVEDEQPAREHK
jgi:hypothetical protein